MNINEAFMMSSWSFNFFQNKFEILKFGFQVFNVSFYCHICVKDLCLLVFCEKIIIISKYKLNICDLNFI